MTPQERVATKIIQYDEPLLKYKTKAELLVYIQDSDVDISVLKGEMVDDLYYISCEIQYL